MSVDEICYHMHSSAFHVYGQLYDLITKGFARVAGEAGADTPGVMPEVDDLPESVAELIWSAEKQLEKDPEAALVTIQRALREEPNNTEAQALLQKVEEKFIKYVYENEFPPNAVPKLLAGATSLSGSKIGPQEGFVLSRINGDWDVQS